MTREEMIELAKQTRKNVTNAPVSQELLDQYPAEVILREVDTRSGKTDVYDTAAPNVVENGPLIINLHGGGFIRERTANDEVFCRRISGDLGCRVLDIDYKIAPDYPFPTALYESYDVVKWAMENAGELKIDPKRVALCGHSAGGNLVCGINRMAKESGEFQTALAVLDYPPLDLYTDPAEKKTMGKGIPHERARLYNLYYCDRDEQKNPLVSPYYASEEELAGFPKTLVMTAGTDDLCNEAEEFALKLGRAGTEVTLKRFPNSGHGFTIYRTEGYEEAMELIERFLEKNL